MSLTAAASELARRDPDVSALLAIYGPPPLWGRRPGFATLVGIVLGQQVSLASAEATYRRLSAGVGRVTPHAVLRRSPAQLRRMGLTRQKARYCSAIAHAVVDGDIDLPSLDRAPCDVVRAALTRITGVGRWTADVYLLMALRRPDVWPRGDLALYRAMREVKRIDAAPAQLDALADAWRPWRSVAARMLWHQYLSVRRNPSKPGTLRG